jgi:hypothetical protein
MPRLVLRRAPGSGALWLAPILIALASPAPAVTLDFEELGAGLPIDGSFFYDGRSAYDPGDPDATDFESHGATFNNEFTEFVPGCCWQGFAYSQTTDTTTPGPANQFSAVTGAGVGGSATYAIGFPGGTVDASLVTRIDLGAELAVAGAYFTNTTWAAHSMQNGDAFAKRFGGASGDDPDFFRLTVTGYDGLGGVTGAVEFFLADYRFADGALDYIVMDWTWVDLSALGFVSRLDFTLASSDTGFGFINTPAYFAMDDLVLVPEPGAGALLALGLAGLAAARRRPRAAPLRGLRGARPEPPAPAEAAAARH